MNAPGARARPPITIVDAFTSRPFSGNPAAVCLLEQAADEDWMQAVAAEMNLSETAFLVPGGEAEWSLRWFTPKLEVNLCGHATLASAHVLWTEAGTVAERLRFHTRSGVLTAERCGDGICLDFPADPPAAAHVPAGLEASLGTRVHAVHRGREDLLVVLDDAAAVRALRPDFDGLARIELRGICVTARSDDPRFDFISRFFGPRAGIPEDPVTGSAHCILGPYWGAVLGKTELRGFQSSARGGDVGVRLAGQRVRLQGRAVTTLHGQLQA